MKKPDNYSELLHAAKVLAEHCNNASCKDCPFDNGMNDCALTHIPLLWGDWLPKEMNNLDK